MYAQIMYTREREREIAWKVSRIFQSVKLKNTKGEASANRIQ